MSRTATTTQLEVNHSTPLENFELGSLAALNGRNVPENSGGETVQDDDPPPNAHGQIERWNYPKGNIWRLAFAFLSFIIAGMNDAAVGVRALTFYWTVSRVKTPS